MKMRKKPERSAAAWEMVAESWESRGESWR